MKFLKNKLSKTFGIYILSNIINSAIPFLLLPILTTYLSPSSYAKTDLFFVIVQFLIPLIGLNVFSAITRYYFDKNTDLRLFISSTFFVILTGSIFISLLTFFGKDVIERYTQIPSSWVYTIVLYAISQNIIQVVLALWQVKYKAVQYGIFRIIRTLVDIILSLIFIISFFMDWQGRILGQTLAACIFALIAFYFLLKENLLVLKINMIYLKKMILFGTPLILHTLGSIIISYSDRLFITNMINIEITGYYAVGYQIGMIIYLIQNSFNQAWTPWLFEKLNENHKSSKLHIIKFTYGYFSVLIILWLILSLVAPHLFGWFITKKYLQSIQFILWIALGFVFNGMYKMVAAYIFYIKKTY
ncbi:MAG TPA: flippase, partial [Bacteroidales bacterium]|nr:flippase [Bacteroidales bacterium]